MSLFGLTESKCLEEVYGKDEVYSKKDIFNAIYPVGSIYLSVNNVNPNKLFGGTWVAWGAGRVPVGVNTGDSAFNSVEKTGGEKSHKLTLSEIPSHGHSIPAHTHSLPAHTHPQSAHTHSVPNHTHTLPASIGQESSGDGTMLESLPGSVVKVDFINTKKTISSGACTTGSAGGGNTGSGGGGTSGSGGSGNTGSTGSSGTHNNLQPYITCYMWKRTA